MTSDLTGRVALVTGAARGIGAAAARAMAEQGAVVVLADLLDNEGQALANQISSEGHGATYRHLDVADEGQWKDVVDAAVKEFGRLDILVNNAGIGSLADVEHETVEAWNRTIDVDQKGVWLGMRFAIPEMRKVGGGSVINISSIFGKVGGFGGSVAYHAAKGAVRLMTKNAAIRYAAEGIRVNSVHPGFIDTPMLSLVKGTDIEKLITDGTPMGRLGRSEEVGSVIAFLAGDGASYMTGSEVYVDGGWTAR